MSVIFCENCDKHIDTDFDVEHLDECQPEESELDQMKRVVGTLKTMTDYIDNLNATKDGSPSFRGLMNYLDSELERLSK